MLRYVEFRRHPNRERLAINPATVSAIEEALPSSAHISGAARITTLTGREYVVEGGIDDTIRKLAPIEVQSPSADAGTRVARIAAGHGG